MVINFLLVFFFIGVVGVSMAIHLIWSLQNLWPFSLFRYDDLKVSKDLVNKLSIPEHMKQFVYAIPDPESCSVIYILSALNLSERSASDAECLIGAVKPDAVVAQVGLFPVTEIRTVKSDSEEIELHDNYVDDSVPTSAFGVIKKCFFDKIGRDKYESVAGNLVMREIFGVGFHGHLLAAKNVAEEVGSSFIVIESPFVKFTWGSNDKDDDGSLNLDSEIKFHSAASSLVPQKLGSLSPISLRRFCFSDEGQLQIMKVLSPYRGLLKSVIDNSRSDLEMLGNFHSTCDYEVPPFAKSIYPLLVDLHNIFADFLSISRALGHAQRLLSDVNKGEVVDKKVISEVYNFRLAVEGLRIALNNSGRFPVKRKGSNGPDKINFSELPVEEKSQALFAAALKSQTKNFKTIVAVVDAGCLAGLRHQWGNPLPKEIEKLVGQLITNCGHESDVPTNDDRKQPLASKPIVAVGAGVTAFWGASSLSKVLPASTFVKVMTLKVPVSLKLFLTQSEKVLSLAFRSKLFGSGIASTGAKTTSALKTTASAEKIRVVAHSLIASLEKTSFSATRTAFYEIMRKRKVQPVGFVPWSALMCSIGTCTGLLMCGDGIECAAESLPAAPSIANLGRGIQHLHLASQAAMETDRNRLHKSIESLMYRLRKSRFQ